FHGVIDEVHISNIARTSFTSPPTDDANTVALWHCDESVGTTVYDETSNNNNGVMNGATWAGPVWTSGQVGNALSFDGVDDYVEIPDSNNLDITGELTLMAWVKRDTIGTNMEILGKWDAAGNHRSYELFIRPTNKVVLAISRDGGYAFMEAQTTATFTDTTIFHHIAATYNPSIPAMNIYIDGVLQTVTTTGSQSSIHSGTGKVIIGVRESGAFSNNYFDGIIDEVGIWSRALTSTEISIYHAAGLIGKGYCPSVVYVDDDYDSSFPGWGYYRFDNIQDGVDAVCDGGTVYVYNGIYNEAVSISNKGLKIIGESEIGVIVQAGTSFTGSSNVFTLNSPGKDVTIEYLTIRHGNYGLRSYAGNVDVLHCTIYHNGWDGTGVDDTPTQSEMAALWASSATSNGGGIRIKGSTGSEIAYCTVYENLRGIRLSNSFSPHIHNCLSHHNIESGIYLSSVHPANPGVDNAIVEYCESHHNMNNGLLNIGGSDNIWRNNNVHDNWNSGVMLWYPEEITIESNIIDTNNLYSFNGIGNPADAYGGVDAGGFTTPSSFAFKLIGNTISSNGQGANTQKDGVHLRGNLNVGTALIDIKCNTFTNHDIDVHILSQAATTTVNCNNFDGANIGIQNVDTSTTLDGTLNWWGEISGPSHSTLNPSGTGDSVSDYVDFDPWSYRIDPCEPKSKGFWKTHEDSVGAILDEYGPIYLGDFLVDDSSVAKEIFVNAKAKNANTMLAAELLATKLNTLHFAHLSLDGSVSYWKLDDGSGLTAEDSIDANDGTLTNGPSWVDGISGNAVEFDGTDDYVVIGDVLDNVFAGPDKEFSVDFWVKINSFPNGIPGKTVASWLIGKVGDSVIGPENQREFGVILRPDGSLDFAWANLVGNWRVVRTSTPLTTGTWYHIAAVYDGSIDTNNGLDRVDIYVNGVAQSTYMAASPGTLSDIQDGNAKLSMGAAVASNGDHGYWFDGLLDEVRIYSKALCVIPFSLHYNMGLADQFLSEHDYNGPEDPGEVSGPNKQEALNIQKQLEEFNTGEGCCP
ncbi:MAG: LamG-like jellyroll fold domain-containing protein, partial [Candidatus Kariarchaeaceae archaeon]